MVFFDAVVTPGSVLGVILAFSAGLVYSYGKSVAFVIRELPTYQKVENEELGKD